MSDDNLRDDPPKGLNTVNMSNNGIRTGPLSMYGSANAQESVTEAMQAWDVRAHWLANPTGLLANDGIPKITSEGGPSYMLLFGDNKWRFASFAGMNGPPWMYCESAGWAAPNGQAAWLMRRLAGKIKQRETLEEQVRNAGNEIADLKGLLSEAMKPQQEQTG